jgi:hypothetical protein
MNELQLSTTRFVIVSVCLPVALAAYGPHLSLTETCNCGRPSPFPESSTTSCKCPAFSTRIMGSPQEEATQLKNKGNEAFKNQDWPAALDFYTKAIELWDKEPSFYTNRAQVGRPSA